MLNQIAPRFSRRRLLLSITRSLLRAPSSLVGRLSKTNFENARVCSQFTIHCSVCGGNGGMYYDFPDARQRLDHGIGLLRESLLCKHCGATMRHRTLASGLLKVISERSGRCESDLRALRNGVAAAVRILDTDSFSPLNKVLRGLPGYVHSQFVPGAEDGATLPEGSINVNLEAMPFQDGSFDLVLTSDVMEHVADDVRAHKEIHRCLVSGGTYLFTVPFDPSMMAHKKLTVEAGRSGTHFFLQRHIHGDPHSDSGIVAHRIYGQQLFSDMEALGYSVRFESVDDADRGIFGGDLFLAVT